MTETLLSPEATKMFNDAMTLRTYRYQDGEFHEIVTFMITPAGVLKKPIIADLTTGKLYINMHTPLTTHRVPRGYLKTVLNFADGSWTDVGVHQIIHFADNYEWSSAMAGTVVHHKNGIKNDNRAINLMLDTSSNNVSRFFDGRDNQKEISNQEYLNDRISLGTVPLIHKGKLIDGYTINTMGKVFKKNRVGETVEVKTHHASKKYRMNMNVYIAGVTASLHNLMAENFLKTPKGKYKTLFKDSSIANPYQPQNLYTVAKKQV